MTLNVTSGLLKCFIFTSVSGISLKQNQRHGSYMLRTNRGKMWRTNPTNYWETSACCHIHRQVQDYNEVILRTTFITFRLDSIGPYILFKAHELDHIQKTITTTTTKVMGAWIWAQAIDESFLPPSCWYHLVQSFCPRVMMSNGSKASDFTNHSHSTKRQNNVVLSKTYDWNARQKRRVWVMIFQMNYVLRHDLTSDGTPVSQPRGGHAIWSNNLDSCTPHKRNFYEEDY